MFMIPAVFGLLWGLGAVGFGLGVSAVGLALGYAVIMGLVLSLGAFIPMAALHPQEILTAKGVAVVVGVAAMVFGIALFGKAGMRKEQEQGKRTGEITKFSTASMKLGLAICIVGGIFSCFPNVGFALSQPLIDLAEACGTSSRWAGNVVWSILFSGGAVVNLAYCSYLFRKNGSLKKYFCGETLRNLCLMALVSSMWIGSFCLYGVGAQMMGAWGTVIGWSVFIALSVSIAGFWGIAQGEWAGTSSQTRRLMLSGIAILVFTILILAGGGLL
jgi:L-rhamnose-H+ transport protein